MNCEEAQRELSGFLDKVIAAEAVRGVETHLASCPRCQEELRSLAECRRLVSDLPLVDPPESFVARVMAEVREAAGTSSFWERLFFPLRIKIPLQATAVVLLGILSVYLYQAEKRLKKDEAYEPATPSYRTDVPARNKQEFRKEPAAPATSLPRGKKADMANKPSSDTAERSPEETSQDKAAAPAAIGERQPQSAPAAAPKSRLEHEEKLAKRPPIPAEEAAASRENSQTSADAIGRSASEPGASLSQDESHSVPLPPERALRSSSDHRADYELVIRRKPAQLRDRAAPITGVGAIQKRAETDTSAKSMGGRSAGELASRSSTSMPEILWYTVPRDRYDQFKKELSAQGSIESEIALAVRQKESEAKSDRPLSIKVTILPPSGDEPAAPSPPPASPR